MTQVSVSIDVCGLVQLYWGAKSELGQVVTRLSEVYESAKRDAVARLQQAGMETVAVGNSDVVTGAGKFISAAVAESMIWWWHGLVVAHWSRST